MTDVYMWLSAVLGVAPPATATEDTIVGYSEQDLSPEPVAPPRPAEETRWPQQPTGATVGTWLRNSVTCVHGRFWEKS